MTMPVLTPEEVREYISDKVEHNHLLDDVEFSNTRIDMAVEMAMNEFDTMIPVSKTNIMTFPNKAVLLYGTLSYLFSGQAALLARNTMNYSDGGLQIPVEERMQLYQTLAAMYRDGFVTMAKSIKLYYNIEDGWGGISSDYANFPLW